MSTIQEIRCGGAAKTALKHISELTDAQHYNSTGLSLTINKLEDEIALLKVIQESWLRAESAKQPIMEETSNQNQNA